jgi:hypothetical protein
VNATVRSQQHQENPETTVNKEVWAFDIEVNPPSLIENSCSDVNPGEALAAVVMHQKGHRIEAHTVLGNRYAIAADTL